MEQLKQVFKTCWSDQDSKTKIAIACGSFITFSYIGIKYLQNKPKIYRQNLDIIEFIKNEIWTRQYSVEIIGTIYYAKCSVIRLSNGKFLIHSPGPLDDEW